MARRLPVLSLIVCALVVLALLPRPMAAQDASADLALTHVTGPHHARVGHQVTYRIRAANLGPDPSELDTIVTLSAGLELVDERCDFGVSPDTPACEYSNIAPGTRVTSVVVLNVLPGAGPQETLTVCTSNEGQTTDPDPNNDCVSLPISVKG